MNRPAPNQLFVLGLAIGFPPWMLSLFSPFATGGVFVSAGFGFVFGNTILALTIAYYAGSDSRPMSRTTKSLLGFLGFLVVAAFPYSIVVVARPRIGLGILVTLGPLLAVYYSFRKLPADAESSGFEETESMTEETEPTEPETNE
ncbi:hypothetical protein [Haladaptatus sp. NG-SE-30]